ncbi:MAG TPA: alkaline phosphatase family protein, partial [Solirubrobacterales bacterium]|nr:alkaline phosphatase family protein [Solirubrobacterales bacterium]
MIPRAPDHSSKLQRGELADPAECERLEAENSDEFLRRREFLGRTAALAGLAGMASVLPSETLVAQAAKAAARSRPLPSPRDVPIDTFVVLMMENRSFDHYFGWHEGADGQNKGLRYPDIDGNLHRTHHLTPDFMGCEFRDPDHGWKGGRHQ